MPPLRFSLSLLWLSFLAFHALAQLPPPAVTHISPTSAPTSGGTEVTVFGEFLVAQPVCGVQPGSCSANTISIGYYSLQMLEQTQSRLVGRTHPMSAGTYDVTVRRADGASVVFPNAFTVGGQGYERVLIPIVIPEEVPGAFGSRWKSHLVGFNGSFEPVRFEPFPGACQTPTAPIGVIPCEYDVAPRGVIENVAAIPRAPGQGALLYIPLSHQDDLHLQLRIQDVSRQALTWGTEIPIVRQEDVTSYPQEIQLLNVPTDDRFRVTLRIYNFDGESTAPGPLAMPMHVTVYRMDGTNVIANTIVALTSSPGLPDFPRYPGYAQLDLGTLFPAIVNQGPVRVVVGGAGYFVRYWAFLSITNNETQHVTTITPQ